MAILLAKGAGVTTAIAKTIQIYLPTGDPRGLRIADITTRLVLAILIPRSELAAGKLRRELDHPGVYFLLGEDEDSAKPIVTIGQTKEVGRYELDNGQVPPNSTHVTDPMEAELLDIFDTMRMLVSGVMEERDGEYVFTQDFLFSSLSTEAAVVLGRSANGWVEWKDDESRTLSDVYRAPTEATERDTNL